MVTQADRGRNQWRNKGRLRFPVNGLVLYAPLWNSQLSGSPFNVWNIADGGVYSATVTGAVWGSQGRTFDGLDDLISTPAAASINNIWDGGGTIWAWINPTSDGQNDRGRICDKGWGNLQINDESAGNCDLKMEVLFDGVNNGTWSTTARDLVIGAWNFILITYNSDAVENNPIFYINNVVKTVGSGITESSTPLGTRIADSAVLGIGDGPSGGSAFDGIQGEQGWHKSRILSAAEARQFYLATKWRYV